MAVVVPGEKNTAYCSTILTIFVPVFCGPQLSADLARRITFEMSDPYMQDWREDFSDVTDPLGMFEVYIHRAITADAIRASGLGLTDVVTELINSGQDE